MKEVREGTMQQSVDIPGGEHSKCKGPELTACLACQGTAKMPVRQEWSKRGEKEQVRFTNKLRPT